jgi:hypothetical protein
LGNIDRDEDQDTTGAGKGSNPDGSERDPLEYAKDGPASADYSFAIKEKNTKIRN